MNNTEYTCDDCDWRGTIDAMAPIDDIEERVMAGELMAAGQCPDCDALISVDDADVPDYVLDCVMTIMRARGWIVTEPGQAQAAPVSGPAKPRPLDGLR